MRNMLISAPPSRPRRVLTRRVKSIDLRDKLRGSGVAGNLGGGMGGAAFCTSRPPSHTLVGAEFERVSVSHFTNAVGYMFSRSRS